MIKAILFDFNGVIIDDEKIQHEAYRKIFAADGLDVSDDDYYARLGMDDKSFVASILQQAGKAHDQEVIDRYSAEKTEFWRTQVEGDLPLFPGIENFVRKMANQFSLGLVSMAKREEIDHALNAAGLADKFLAIVSTEDISRYKPDPEAYRLGFDRLDLARTRSGHLPMTHGECIVIEDSPAGVASARAADLSVLGVTNTVSAAELRAAGAEWVATDLDDWMPASIEQVFSAKL